MSSQPLDRSTELGRLVHSARSDLPDAAVLSRIAAKLPEGAPPGAAGTSAAGLSGGMKLLLGLVVAGGVGAGSYAALEGGFGGTPQRAGAAEMPSDGAALAPQVAVAPAVAPPSVSAAAVAAQDAVAEDAVAQEAVARDVAAGQDAPSAAAKPASAAKTGKPGADSLSQEAKLLERARRELVKQPAKALATTQEHKRRFPNGLLSQEREVIAIQALKALKLEGEANRRAASFEAEHPESAHQRKVESVVEK